MEIILKYGTFKSSQSKPLKVPEERTKLLQIYHKNSPRNQQKSAKIRSVYYWTNGHADYYCKDFIQNRTFKGSHQNRRKPPDV